MGIGIGMILLGRSPVWDYVEVGVGVQSLLFGCRLLLVVAIIHGMAHVAFEVSRVHMASWYGVQEQNRSDQITLGQFICSIGNQDKWITMKTYFNLLRSISSHTI
jgi:hypothetical protein